MNNFWDVYVLLLETLDTFVFVFSRNNFLNKLNISRPQLLEGDLYILVKFRLF